MSRIFSRFLDGAVCAFEPVADGPLEPVAIFHAGVEEVCAHSVAPDLKRAVYATRHAVVCVGRDAGEQWRYELRPRSGERYGHRPACAFSLDGAEVWVYRPDAMAGRGPTDRWVVLDAGSGEVRGEAALETAGHGGEHFRHISGTCVLLDVGEGQDGTVIYRGALTGEGLELHRYPWGDRCLIDFAPDGARFMTVNHDQGDVAFHDFPGGGVLLRLPLDAFGHDADDASVEWSGGYLEADTVIVTVGGETEDGEDWHRHYRVDPSDGNVLGPFDAGSQHAYDVEPLGDGSWLVSDGAGRPVRTRARR
ncbi:hypothetical protein [Actinomadura monticuli]|uniref:S9 family peptidase n=1 Tax=Actinomadura monticuli TaxID=3097367 RepID=A0ABV4Q5P9_9ACTN